jgi:hypothetical protein
MEHIASVISYLRSLFVALVTWIFTALMPFMEPDASKRAGRELVSDEMLFHLDRFARYSRLAYSSYLQNVFKDRAAEFPQYYRNSTIFSTVSNNSTDVFALILVDPVHKEVIVAFRGSVTTINWVENFNALPVPWKDHEHLDPSIRVHNGFQEDYQSLSTSLFTSLAALYSEHKVDQAWSTFVIGHSMGGALALAAALDHINPPPSILPIIQPYNPKIRLVTFGQPRLGNAAFARHVASCFPHNITDYLRVVNSAEIVPHVPPKNLGYCHAGTELWASPYETVTWAPSFDFRSPPYDGPPSGSSSLKTYLVFEHLFFHSIGLTSRDLQYQIGFYQQWGFLPVPRFY